MNHQRNGTTAVPFFVALTFVLGSHLGQADNVAKSEGSTTKPFHAALGEGQTLPAGVVRARSVNKFISADRGFDEHGRSVATGYRVQAVASAIVAEYGFTDHLTFQFMAPFVVQNQASIDGEQFRNSQVYREKYDALVEKVVTKLDGLICSGYEQCRQLIESGYKLPYDLYFPLPDTGEAILLDSNVEVKKYLDSFILNQAAPSPGRHGLGDIEAGLLYNFYRTDDTIISGWIGSRFPTGSFEQVPNAYRPTGSGIAELGFRGNVDYQPVYGLWLSWQEQHEVPLIQASRQTTSLQDNTEVAPRRQSYEQKGIRRKGFVQASYGLGAAHQSLKAVAVTSGYNYRFERSEYVDGRMVRNAARVHSYVVGTSIDGRGYKIPAAFDVSYETPISGKNAVAAPSVLTLTLKAYARF